MLSMLQVAAQYEEPQLEFNILASSAGLPPDWYAISYTLPVMLVAAAAL
jgi:hypothetical protein